MVVMEAARVGAVPAAAAREERGQVQTAADDNIVTVLLLHEHRNVGLQLIKVKFKLLLTIKSSSSLSLFIAETLNMELEVLTFDPLCALPAKLMHLLSLSTYSLF